MSTPSWYIPPDELTELAEQLEDEWYEEFARQAKSRRYGHEEDEYLVEED